MTFVTRIPRGPTVANSKVWGVNPNIDLYTTITLSLQEILVTIQDLSVLLEK